MGAERICLEIGCGKGKFIDSLAGRYPETGFVAVEGNLSVAYHALEKVEASGHNVLFLLQYINDLADIFDAGELNGIYLNFSDPWPKSRDAKFRLTAPAFLRSYADALPVGGELQMKTDNLPLFEWSLKQLEQEKWELREVTTDLHAQGRQGLLTDYETRFLQEGIPICRLVAVRAAGTLDGGAGIPPRLRDAALSDARGNQTATAEKKENAE